MQFQELNLHPSLLQAVRDEGYSTPTPIQQLAIPPVLKGRDVLGCAQTGTGKTAAFALPVLHLLMQKPQTGTGKHRRIRVLVLAPTRELAAQIDESFAVYGATSGVRHTVVFGGVNQNPQTRALGLGVDVLVATPGRLMDLMAQGFIDLSAVEILILDEGDRMLDMGFIHDIKRIVATMPTKRQTLLFSATMPPAIRKLAGELLNNPQEVSATPSATPVELISQSVILAERPEKIELLTRLLKQHDVERALVFSRTKYGAENIARKLSRSRIPVAAIHGDRSQNQRISALEDFKQGVVRVLVATDIASRGLDIDGVSHVFNFDLPNEPEAYVHRIGRTGRAGAAGIAISFCSTDERDYLRSIERLIGRKLPVEAAPSRPEGAFDDFAQPETPRRPPVRPEQSPASAPRPTAARPGKGGAPAEGSRGGAGRRPGGVPSSGPAGGGAPRTDRKQPSRARRPHARKHSAG